MNNKGEVIQVAQFVGLPDAALCFIFDNLDDYHGGKHLWELAPQARHITDAVALYSSRVRYIDKMGNAIDLKKNEAEALASLFLIRRTWAAKDSMRNDYITFMSVYARSGYSDEAAAKCARKVFYDLHRRGDVCGAPTPDPARVFPPRLLPRMPEFVALRYLRLIYLPVFEYHPKLS